jgi:intracellular sulfur oxidation DsrE/DsrF family protein
MSSTPRRSFLSRLAALVAAGSIAPGALHAATRGAATPARHGAPDERWLNAIAQKEARLIIETGIISDALAFRRALNFLDVYNTDFSTPDDRIGLAVGTHSPALSLVLNDAMWAKHEFGRRYGVNTAAGQPATASPWATGNASVEGLRKRGVEVLACNRALIRLSRELAGAGGNAPAIHAELVANVHPGVIVVPAMIVAVSRAGQRGIPYISVT